MESMNGYIRKIFLEYPAPFTEYETHEGTL